jgi:hypothetical protein
MTATALLASLRHAGPDRIGALKHGVTSRWVGSGCCLNTTPFRPRVLRLSPPANRYAGSLQRVNSEGALSARLVDRTSSLAFIDSKVLKCSLVPSIVLQSHTHLFVRPIFTMTPHAEHDQNETDGIAGNDQKPQTTTYGIPKKTKSKNKRKADAQNQERIQRLDQLYSKEKRKTHFVSTPKSDIEHASQASHVVLKVRRIICDKGFPSGTEIDIKSELLENALSDIFEGVEGLQLNETPPVVSTYNELIVYIQLTMCVDQPRASVPCSKWPAQTRRIRETEVDAQQSAGRRTWRCPGINQERLRIDIREPILSRQTR